MGAALLRQRESAARGACPRPDGQRQRRRGPAVPQTQQQHPLPPLGGPCRGSHTRTRLASRGRGRRPSWGARPRPARHRSRMQQPWEAGATRRHGGAALPRTRVPPQRLRRHPTPRGKVAGRAAAKQAAAPGHSLRTAARLPQQRGCAGRPSPQPARSSSRPSRRCSAKARLAPETRALPPPSSTTSPRSTGASRPSATRSWPARSTSPRCRAPLRTRVRRAAAPPARPRASPRTSERHR